ncbi:MAG: hypothetical protein WD049_00625 [Candidatus Paceibacterota bacterium]
MSVFEVPPHRIGGGKRGGAAGPRRDTRNAHNSPDRVTRIFDSSLDSFQSRVEIGVSAFSLGQAARFGRSGVRQLMVENRGLPHYS